MSQGTHWSSSSGGTGSVLDFLAKKAAVPQQQGQPSRGAIEYFNQQRQAEKPSAGAGNVPKPRSKQRDEQTHVDPTAPAGAAPVAQQKPAPPGVQTPTAGTAVASIADLAKMVGQAGVARSSAAAAAPTAASKASAASPPPSEPSQKIVGSGNAPPLAWVQIAAANITPAPGQSQPSAQAPPPPASAPPAATPQVAQRTRVERHDDARRAKKTNRNSKFSAVMDDSAHRKAEAEHLQRMESDAEYRQAYETMQQMQSSQQSVQAQFFDRYQAQESIRPGEFAQERLDIPMILELIAEHDVVMICTDTGSGKSTSIPKALLEANAANKIVATQPRRTATVSIANRVASLRRERVGDDVGYWIRGEKRGDDQTRLWYMTSYTLLLHLLNHPLDPPFTHIILDEFHERQPDIEVTVALLKLCLKNHCGKFKLILMSATLNTDDWEAYFDGCTVATYKQSEPEHPIHDYFMEDVCTMLGMPHHPPVGITQTMVDPQMLEKHLFVAQHLIMFLNACAHPMHSILVFLPGRAQVEHFQMWLEMTLSQRVDVIPWHSAVELSVIEAAIQRRPYNRQKVYLATDIAEVSITVPDVVFVIDLVLVKRPQIQIAHPASILYPPLVVQWISKGSVAQRRGRVGRVQQGFYFCLLSSPLLRSLPEHADPPIQHARIDELALHSLQLVSNPAAIFSVCRGQPLVQTIVAAMATLSHLGCIMKKSDPLSASERISEIHENSAWSDLVLAEARTLVDEASSIVEYEYTFIGRLLQLIPVSPQQGMLVFYGFMTGLESLMILAAAVTSSLSPFTVTPEHQQAPGHQQGGNNRKKKPSYDSVSRAMESTEQVMKDMSKGLRSDIVAIISAVIAFRVHAGIFGIESPPLRQWCRQNHLSYDKLVAIVDLEAHIKYELANFIPFRDMEDPNALQAQFDKVAPMVLLLTNVAFAAQALEVTSEGSTYAATKEGAVGIFTDLRAVPDLHSPSCLRWEQGDVIVPVSISLHFSRMLVSFSNANRSAKQFWLSLLLFAHHSRYSLFSDDQGVYAVFAVRYCDRDKFIEVDGQTAQKILDFRRRLSNVCATLRLRYSHKFQYEEEFAQEVLAPRGLEGLDKQQREVMMLLASDFFGPSIEQADICEVEHEEDDLDKTTLLSFVI